MFLSKVSQDTQLAHFRNTSCPKLTLSPHHPMIRQNILRIADETHTHINTILASQHHLTLQIPHMLVNLQGYSHKMC